MDKTIIAATSPKEAKYELLASYNGEEPIADLLRKTVFTGLNAVAVAAVVAELLRELDGVHPDELCYYLYN